MGTVKPLSVKAVGLATVVVLGSGTSVSVAASAASDDSGPATRHVMVDGHRVVAGTTIGEWGRKGNGESNSFT